MVAGTSYRTIVPAGLVFLLTDVVFALINLLGLNLLVLNDYHKTALSYKCIQKSVAIITLIIKMRYESNVE